MLLASLGVVVSACVKRPQAPAGNQNPNVNANAATTTAEIDTSNWKTYRNEEYGFEFKYPEDLIVKDWAYKTPNWELLLYIGQNQDIGDGAVSVGVEKDIKNFDDKKIFWPIPRENIQIREVKTGAGNYLAYETKVDFDSVDGGAHTLSYFIKKLDKLLIVSYQYKSKELDENIFSAILSSFIFIH